MHKLKKSGILVVICLCVGYLASVATQSGVNDWFPTLEKPVFNPPAYIFMPVWTALYILMGIAGGIVWSQMNSNREAVRSAMLFFAVQLVLNGVWSLLFFGLKNLLLALIEIVLLWLMIYETWFKFKKINATAGWLFVPYLLWVSFAAVLNASIWWLNK